MDVSIIFVVVQESAVKQNKGNWDNFSVSLKSDNLSTFQCKFLLVTQGSHQETDYTGINTIWGKSRRQARLKLE